MKKDAMKKTLVAGTSAVFALASMGGAALATASPSSEENATSPATAESMNAASARSDLVQLDQVNGTFNYTQGEVTDSAIVKRDLGEAAQYLCGAHGVNMEATNPGSWEITVNGAVSNGFTASFDQLCQTSEVKSVVLGCACAGNPADGRAAVNAQVTGIPVKALAAIADPAETVNTIVFTSADGYEVALPLEYVYQRYCPIVFDLNGAPLAETMGGTNQLWLGSTSANYFVRDVVAVTFEDRVTPPPSPSTDEARSAYQNLPNVGVLLGGDVR
ncbi:molybdopterin-dependent oxidoreductase [Curtanaerobium respiraculi]|uniref:molybdopterin-dependent oxidoreductase n=1 Tax=Curtanaerobium respiraculi TaxID=2949669 RepID=UPI0024B36971|nr:molybdopterin-dependent oxidoreductase [Curtanaerobium respiraculi]